MTISFGGKPVFPPPWTADEAGPAVFIRTEFGNPVCVVRAEGGVSMSLARGTAAHICKCVNEREELVDALRNCITWMDLSDPDGAQAMRDFKRTLDKAVTS
jgi:hypothetical protein